MAYTKRWFVTEAFSEIGLAEYVFDLQPEQLQTGLNLLDSQMATWDGKGIRVGWSIPNEAEQSDLDDEVDVPYYAREAIYLQLALRLAPRFGKTLSPDTKVNAKNAYDALMRENAQPVPMSYPSTLPAGAGNKPWRNQGTPFLGPPGNPLAAGGDGPIDFGTLNPNDTSQGS